MQHYTYATEVLVTARRDKVLDRLSDPFLFTGAMGHVTVVQGALPGNGSFATLSSLMSPVNRFKVVYIFGFENERLHTVPGVVEGPNPSPNGLVYRGVTDDGRVRWEIHLTVLGYSDSDTRLRVTAMSSQEVDLLDRMFGRQSFNMAEHWVKDHLVPYLTLYFRDQTPSVLEVSPNLVFSATGPVKDVVPKALRAMRDVTQGFITVKGEGIRGILTVRNGQPHTAELEYGGKSLSDAEALAQIEEIDSTAKVLGYEVDTWPAVLAIARNLMR